MSVFSERAWLPAVAAILFVTPALAQDTSFSNGDRMAGYQCATPQGIGVCQKVIAGPASYTTPKGYQQITNTQLATVQALTVPTGAVRASVQNNGTQAVRFRNDGTAPTATTGQRIQAGATIEFTGNLAALQFIREADGATLDIVYYG